MTAALGWIGSALVVASLAQRDRQRLHQLNLASAIVLLTFSVIVGIGSMIVLNLVLAAVNGFHLVFRSRPPHHEEPTERILSGSSARL